jgi:hypothetical protein
LFVVGECLGLLLVGAAWTSASVISRIVEQSD